MNTILKQFSDLISRDFKDLLKVLFVLLFPLTVVDSWFNFYGTATTILSAIFNLIVGVVVWYLTFLFEVLILEIQLPKSN